MFQKELNANEEPDVAHAWGTSRANGFMIHIITTCHTFVTLPTQVLLSHRLAIKLQLLPFVDRTEPKNNPNFRKKNRTKKPHQRKIASSNKQTYHITEENKTLQKHI